MTPESFVRGIHDYCFESSIHDTEAMLLNPPGRSPRSGLLELGSWFAALGDVDRVRVMEVARITAHGATFGILAALDGSRKIAEGELELTDGAGTVLASADAPNDLHDLFQAEVSEWLTR